jgi:hypothetical protein
LNGIEWDRKAKSRMEGKGKNGREGNIVDYRRIQSSEVECDRMEWGRTE